MTDSQFVFDVSAENFDRQVLEKSREVPVLVDFWAGWCAPCKMLMPILAGLAEKAGGDWLLAKVDTDAEQSLAQAYQVRSLPTVKLFRNGEVVDEFMGALPESGVREFLDRHVDRESDRIADRADQAAADGDLDTAEELFRQALALDPDNPRIVFRHIGLLLRNERLAEAEQTLAALPIALAETADARRLRAEVRFRLLAKPGPDADTADSPVLRARAAQALIEGRYEEALELLMQLLSRDPKYAGEAPRDDLLAAYELIPDGDLVNRYRRRMFNLLH